MPILDRYLAREILLPFAAGLLFLSQILLATQVLAQADVLFGSGVALLDVATVIGALLPYFIGFVLPIAFLLGAVVGVGRLADDREIVALSAAGVSPLRLVRVPVLLGVLAAAAGVWLAFVAEPASLRIVRTRVNEILKKNVSSDVKPGTFYDQIPGYTLYAQRVEGGRWEDVLISDASNPDAPILALARRGRLEPVGQGKEMMLLLEGGELHREEAATDEYVVAEFGRAEVVIGVGGAISDRTSLTRSSRELTFAQLVERSTPGEGRAEKEVRWYAAYLHRRLAAPLAMIPFAIIAVGLGAFRRGGRAFGVAASIALVVVQYLFLRGGEVLAQKGTLPAWAALQLGNAVLLLAGLGLLALVARRGTGAVR